MVAFNCYNNASLVVGRIGWARIEKSVPNLVESRRGRGRVFGCRCLVGGVAKAARALLWRGRFETRQTARQEERLLLWRDAVL